jgi:hypothetical protein
LFERIAWIEEAAAVDGAARLGVLVRTDPEVPWDAEPDGNGLHLFWQGDPEVGGAALQRFADRLEWRVFVDHPAGSFDALNGLSHGWKTTPLLRLMAVDYLAPGRVLRSVER